MLKILVADDHPIVRQGLKQILAETQDLIVAGEADSGAMVLKRITENDYDLVLLDITMPGQSGLDILQELQNMRPKLPVLVLSIHPEKQYALRMLKAGASGYLTKDRAPDELVEAIRRVSRGGKYISTSFAEILAFDPEKDHSKQIHETLSNREYQVMCLIASGKKVKEISQDLSLSVKTISTYRTRILAKMKMKNNAELIHYAIEHNLINY